MEQYDQAFEQSFETLTAGLATGFVTRYYPEGMNALYAAKMRASVEELATTLGEPVFLALHSPHLAKHGDVNPTILQLFVPENAVRAPYLKGTNAKLTGWRSSYLPGAQRHATAVEAYAAMASSIATADAPFIDFVDGKITATFDTIKQRTTDLFRKTGHDIFTPLACVPDNVNDILSGAEISGKQTTQEAAVAKRNALSLIRQSRTGSVPA